MRMFFILLASVAGATVTPGDVKADSLRDISQFAKEICDDIQARGNRNITKTDIQAELKG